MNEERSISIMNAKPSFMDVFAYSLIEDLSKSKSLQSKEPQRSRPHGSSSEGQSLTSLYVPTEFKEKCNKTDGDNNKDFHVYFFDITFEWSHDNTDVTSFDSIIPIKLGAMVEYPSGGALYLQTNPLNREYLMNFAEGICIEETGPVQMAKVFLEAFETCIVKECSMVTRDDDNNNSNGASLGVSIQIIHYHPGLEQNVKFFEVHTNDYRKGYIGPISLCLFKTHLFCPNPNSFELFQDFWSKSFVGKCSTVDGDIQERTIAMHVNPLSLSTENGCLQEEEKKDGTQSNKRSMMVIRNVPPLHGVIRCKKKKKSGKLVYETM